ncbi:hypothetical protein GCM10010256_73250 [Streptomyces coeruleorubidus]|nr:hypothetical protein GCM10010256_73250 [Streptomyces coeruleorubidus]
MRRVPRAGGDEVRQSLTVAVSPEPGGHRLDGLAPPVGQLSLKAWRGIATRYDKTPDSYLAGLHLRASMIWIKDLTRTTQ